MKPKFALLFTAMAIYTSVFSTGQGETKTDEKPFKRVYIGLGITPEVSYRYLHGNFVPAGSTQQDIQQTITYSNQHSTAQAGVNATVKVGVNITRWLAVESGIGFSLIRYRYKATQNHTPDIWPGTSLIQQDSFLTTDQQIYEYMTVPIGLRFSMGHKKVRGIIAAGVNLDFLVKYHDDYTYTYSNGTSFSNNQAVATNNFNTFNVSPYLGVGIDCYLSRVFVLRIMPQAEIQGLKNINTPITEYLWTAGLNVSFLFGL